MTTATSTAAADLLLLYPQQSLHDQMKLWVRRHPERLVARCFERSLPAIRKQLRSVDNAIVDATVDPALAVEAFLQAVRRLGPEAVAVYTETAHEGLELFVRVRGSLFLLGPLFGGQWEDFFDRWLHAVVPLPAALGSRPRRAGRSPAESGRQRLSHPINRIRARFYWSYGDLL